MTEYEVLARGLELLYNRWLQQHGDPHQVRFKVTPKEEACPSETKGGPRQMVTHLTGEEVS